MTLNRWFRSGLRHSAGTRSSGSPAGWEPTGIRTRTRDDALLGLNPPA